MTPTTAPSSTATTTAAVLRSPRELALQKQPLRDPGPGEVRVRIEGCGVCASSLPLWQGREWFAYPREAGEPGHEGWGIIDAIGEGVTSCVEGERVAMISHHAFAEFDIAPADALVALPPELDGEAFPGEALGCAMNVMRRAGTSAGETIAVIGVGFLGALAIQLARASADDVRIVAVSRRQCALDLAQSLGANQCFELADPAAASVIGETCNCVIEATGHADALDLATDIVAQRGRLVVAGYHQDGLRHINMQKWNWKGIDVINAHERDRAMYVRGVRDAAHAVAAGLIDPAPLYTHQFPLAELDCAFELLEERPRGFIKAMVNP